jgi:hypothetical protein
MGLQSRPETALYFPYIQVPESPWFTRVLLYWDQAAAIVPDSLDGNGRMTNTYMRELVDERLLIEMRPDSALARVDSTQYNETFLRHLATEPAPGRQAKFSRIHIGKMPPELFDELSARGLAYEMTHSYGWWMVESSVADRYMAYLASYISSRTPGMFPVTDRPGTLTALVPKARALSQDPAQRINALRYAIIKDVLPAPKGSVRPAELRRFKEENAEPLQRCLDELNDGLSLIAAQDDPVQMLEAELRLRRKISAEVTELQEQMARRRWPRIGVVNVGAVANAGLGVFDAFDGAYDPMSLAARVAIGLWGVAGPVQETVEAMREPQIDRQKPMAYAVMASRLSTNT